MPSAVTVNKIKISAICCALLILCFLGIWFRIPIWEKITDYYHLFSDRERIKQLIISFGSSAPAVFILIQIFQVLLAPVPGEATGFIGGYLFGTLAGFIYSSIGLTVGSWINFVIGRLLGERYVRKLIPAKKFEKIDALVRRQGIIFLFILFLFPGFPKDYLCLALGLSTLPLKIFILLAGIGRIPGTFALSLQGAYLYEQNYALLGMVMVVCLLLAMLCYVCRHRIYRWIERWENK